MTWGTTGATVLKTNAVQPAANNASVLAALLPPVDNVSLIDISRAPQSRDPTKTYHDVTSTAQR